MKITKSVLLSLAISFAILLIITQSKTANKRSQTNAKYWVKPLIKTAKSYLSFANLAYCNADVINSLACPLCSTIIDASYKVLDVQSFQDKTHVYKYVILASASHKEVVVTFSGPKSTENSFYASIYTSGFGKIHGQGVENAFLNVYRSEFSTSLHRSIQMLLAKIPNIQNYKFVFAGHSFGGSLAVLAAFDLMKTNSLPSQEAPTVYSYGQLRIGNDKFVEEVNAMFKVIRIVKNSDHMTRLNNCVWSESVGKWRCFRDTYQLMMRFPEYRKYIMHYDGKNYQTGFHVAHTPGRSFLEKSSRRGYYYTTNNPGHIVNSYGSTLENQGAKSYGNVYYSQPMGAEILFSEKFKKYNICNYYRGVPDCEKHLPREFNSRTHTDYYGTNVEEC
jgi:hypothetical protein